MVDFPNLGGWFTAIHSHGGAQKKKIHIFQPSPHVDSSNTEGIYMGRTYQYHPKTFFHTPTREGSGWRGNEKVPVWNWLGSVSYI